MGCHILRCANYVHLLAVSGNRMGIPLPRKEGVVLSRRGLIAGLLVTPAIVRYNSLMKLSVPRKPAIITMEFSSGHVYSFVVEYGPSSGPAITYKPVHLLRDKLITFEDALERLT